VVDARIGILVPNLFMRVPVDTAVRAAGASPVTLAGADEAGGTDCAVVIVDLDPAGGADPELVEELAAAGRLVLAFAPHVEAGRLAAARAAGATVLPRGAFLARLPELLTRSLRRASKAGGERSKVDRA
jgi:hypothetical protein